MNFLQLAQRLRQEVAGSGTGPSSVAGQGGELKRIVDWIATADEDIQRKHNEWRFMRAGFTVNTVANTAAYAASVCTDTATNQPITAFRSWCKDSFKIYLQSSGLAGERPLDDIDYDAWYRLYNTATQSAGFPTEFTVLNNQAFSLGARPNAVYVVSGEYQKAVKTLAANADVPPYPDEYHLLPMYRAMMKYGRYTGATEVYQDGQNEYRRMMNEMELTQLPEFLLAGALA